MNQSELVTLLAEKCDVSEVTVRKILMEMSDVIIESIANNEEVRLWGLGKFIRRAYKERSCYNPIKNKVEKISSSYVPVFKPGTRFKARVNK